MKLLQRNNAILKIDMFNQRIIELYSLGVKNWTSFNIDTSDMNDGNAGCYKRLFLVIRDICATNVFYKRFICLPCVEVRRCLSTVLQMHIYVISVLSCSIFFRLRLSQFMRNLRNLYTILTWILCISYAVVRNLCETQLFCFPWPYCFLMQASLINCR